MYMMESSCVFACEDNKSIYMIGANANTADTRCTKRLNNEFFLIAKFAKS